MKMKTRRLFYTEQFFFSFSKFKDKKVFWKKGGNTKKDRNRERQSFGSDGKLVEGINILHLWGVKFSRKAVYTFSCILNIRFDYFYDNPQERR